MGEGRAVRTLSKLGPHINFVTEADAMRDFILQARPAVVKTLHHDATFWAEIKQQAPEVLLIGRRFESSQPFSDPERDAERMAGRILDMSTARIMDAWEGYNELSGFSQDERKRYARFDKRLAEVLHSEGLKYVCGSWSVGRPDIPEWKDLYDALRVADYIGVHEYCAPRMDDPRGLDDTTDPLSGWFVLRYRKWWPTLPPDCQKPVIISECGIDSGACHWNPGAQGGWRSFTSAQGYLEQLIWYDRYLQADPYIVGATIFCWGTLDPTWDTYDLKGDMSRLLRDYIIASRTVTPLILPSLEEWLGAEMQQHIIPLNPEAFFHKYARQRELGMARTPEIGYGGELMWEGRPVLAQVFVDEINDPQWQHVVWAYLDDARPWDQKTSHFDRPN